MKLTRNTCQVAMLSRINSYKLLNPYARILLVCDSGSIHKYIHRSNNMSCSVLKPPNNNSIADLSFSMLKVRLISECTEAQSDLGSHFYRIHMIKTHFLLISPAFMVICFYDSVYENVHFSRSVPTCTMQSKVSTEHIDLGSDLT